MDRAGDLWRRAWGDKFLFVGLCLAFSLFVCCPLGNVIGPRLPETFGIRSPRCFCCSTCAWFITFIVLGVRRMEANEKRKKRRGHLHGLWEPVDREGQSFLFTDDGGMYTLVGRELPIIAFGGTEGPSWVGTTVRRWRCSHENHRIACRATPRH